MGIQTQRAYKVWSWWLPNAHDDRVKCYSRSQGTSVKINWKVLLQSLWYDVSRTAKEPTGSVSVSGQGNTSFQESRLLLPYNFKSKERTETAFREGLPIWIYKKVIIFSK